MRRLSIAMSGLVVGCLLVGCEAPADDGDGGGDANEVSALPAFARRFDGVPNVTSAAMGPKGEVFFGGDFGADVDFGGGKLSPEQNSSLFVAQVDAYGEHMWSGSTGSKDLLGGVAVGPEGDLYVTGTFGGSINFGSGKLTTVDSDQKDGFFAAFEPGGLPARSFAAGGLAYDQLGAATTTSTGHVLVAGRFGDDVDLGGGASPELTTFQSVVVAYDREGAYQWDLRLSSILSSEPRLSAAPGGDFYLQGNAAPGLALGDDDFPDGVFLAKVSQDRHLLWTVALGPIPPIIDGMGSDAAGNVFLAGTYSNAFQVGDEQVYEPATFYRNGFLAKISPEGEVLFVKTFPSTDYNILLKMAVAADGHVALAASLSDTIDFGSGDLGQANGYDAVVARFTPDGELLEAQDLNGTAAEYVSAVLVGPDGAPVVIGSFEGYLEIGDTKLFAGDGPGTFIARLPQ